MSTRIRGHTPFNSGVPLYAKIWDAASKKVSINHNFGEIIGIQITQLWIQTSQPIIQFTQHWLSRDLCSIWIQFVGFHKDWKLSCDGTIMYLPMLCQMDAYSNFLIKRGCDIWIHKLWWYIPDATAVTHPALHINNVSWSGRNRTLNGLYPREYL